MSSECYIIKRNGTERIPGWEGIPEAIVLNALLATVCLIILSVVRIVYFKRRAYQNNWNISWLQYIYSNRNVAMLHHETLINRLHPNAYLPPVLHEYSHLITNKLHGSSPERTASSSLYVTSHLGEKMKIKHQVKLDSVGKKRFWLLDYLLIKDKDIYEHRGNDAFQYLLFQRYIIYFMTALTAVCMIILLPINIFGKNAGPRYFEMTTINNIKDSDGSLFWVHVILAIFIVILGLLMMKNFSDLIFTPKTESDGRTILIQNVPEQKRNARLLKAFIEKKFIGVEVTQITFTYDIEILKELKKQLETIDAAITYCENHRQECGSALKVSPYFCGRFSPLCPTVDAIEYYTEQKKEYQVLVTEEINRLLSDPKHSVFVQLKNELMAQRILEHFENTHHERVLKRVYKNVKACFVSEKATHTDSFGYNTWNTKPAAFPDDIEWKDIIMNTNTSGICAFVLNAIVFCVFVFLTTPLVATSFLDEISSKIGINNSMNSLEVIDIGSTKVHLAKYLGVLMFNTISLILPNLIMVIVLYTPRNTKSEKNLKVMLSVYIFLILMVFILPSIGLNSGMLLLEKLMDNSNDMPRNLYHCLFPAQSSAWFVHLIISAVFINNSFELMRMTELCFYLINCIIYPRTEAEYIKARMETSFEFNYGSSYPRFLLIFTIVTTYSIACPIITPFGLLYILFKHLVDRYSIYYLYSTPVISPNIHQTAITFVLMSFFFLLLQLTAFLNSRITFTLEFKPSNVCSVALLLYLILLCFTCCNFSSLYQKDYAQEQYRSTGNAKKKDKLPISEQATQSTAPKI